MCLLLICFYFIVFFDRIYEPYGAKYNMVSV